MKGKAIGLFVVALALAISSGVVLAVNPDVAFATGKPDTITVCHATGSHSNPYITNNPSKSGDVGGHDGHDGPIWFSGITTSWGDIIPPFNGEFNYPGKNWTTEGQEFWNSGCNAPTPTPTDVPPTPTNTDVPPTPTSTDVPPTETPTPVPADLSIQVSMGRPSCGVISFIITGSSSVPGTVNIWLNGNLYGQSPYNVDGAIELKFFNVPVPHGLQIVKATLSADGKEVSHENQIEDIACPTTPTPVPTVTPEPPCELVPQYVQWKLWDYGAPENYSGTCYVISSSPPSVDRQNKICTLCEDQFGTDYLFQADRWRRGTVYLNECTGEYVFIFDSGTEDSEWFSAWYRPYMKDNIRTIPRVDCSGIGGAGGYCPPD